MGLPETSQFLDLVEDTEGFSVSYGLNCGGTNPGIATIYTVNGHSLRVGVKCAARSGLTFVPSCSSLKTLSDSWEWFHKQNWRLIRAKHYKSTAKFRS